MKWIRDPTGRFPQRPYYKQDELDQECEGIIRRHLLGKYKKIVYPTSTNDLTILIEQLTDELDLYADLHDEGDDVEGLTAFFPDRKPTVRIASALSEQEWRENRLRTTLAHELGHVLFHRCLCIDRSSQMALFGDAGGAFVQKCKRDTILGAKQNDWMEWQAGYASGSLLMPITPLRRIVGQVLDQESEYSALLFGSSAAADLIARIQSSFQVSPDAARVRLMQLHHLTSRQSSPSLLS